MAKFILAADDAFCTGYLDCRKVEERVFWLAGGSCCSRDTRGVVKLAPTGTHSSLVCGTTWLLAKSNERGRIELLLGFAVVGAVQANLWQRNLAGLCREDSIMQLKQFGHRTKME